MSFQLRYDRRASDDFLKHFLPGGFAESLCQYASARYPIDLQFRKAYKSQAEHATLYVGMTAVLNLYRKSDDRYVLRAHESYAVSKNGWQAFWASPMTPDQWRERWDGVELYLEHVIPNVMTDGRFTATEGAVQAAASVYREDAARVMLDREVTPSFANEATKKSIVESLYQPLVDALATDTPVPGTPPRTLGAKCDLLALDADGHLIAMEIKPGNVSSLAWVPAQATMYAKVLQEWINDDSGWSEVIAGMFQQRKALGLTPAGFELPTLKPEVLPAIAYQRVASPKRVQRMFDVQDHLVKSGVGDVRMKFYTVSISGRLDEVTRP